MTALRQAVVCVVTVGILLFGVTPEVLAASKTTSAVKVIKFKNLAYSHSGQKATAKGNFSVSQRSGTRYKFTGTVKKSVKGGNPAYWRVQTQTSSWTCLNASGEYMSTSCHNEWHNYKRIRGKDSTASREVGSTGDVPAQANSRSVTAGLTVCLNKRFRVDPCQVVRYAKNRIQYRG